jgi:hypothetical protein
MYKEPLSIGAEYNIDIHKTKDYDPKDLFTAKW